MPVDWNELDYTLPAFERQYRIALLRWPYTWGSLPQQPIYLPYYIDAS